MSYERRRYGGGDRRREERRMPETEEQKLRNSIVRLGDGSNFQLSTGLPSVANNIRQALPSYLQVIADGFRISITEQPFKIPCVAALFSLIAQHPESSDVALETSAATSPAQPLFQELCKGFQTSLDRLAWRDLRLTTQFFAFLVLAKTVSVASFLELLQSFLVVLDEPGVSYERMEAAALCVGEGLIRAGSQLFDYDSSAVGTMVSTIRSCLTLSELQQPLTRPVSLLHSREVVGASELLGSLVHVLDGQLATSFNGPVECLPQVHGLFLLSESATPFDIPSTMVPPEDFDFGALTEDSASRRIMMPRLSLQFFDSEISPPPESSNGFVIRSCIIDTINIFEVNRRDCGRLVLDLPRWFSWGTFKGKQGFGPEPANLIQLDYVLESTALEVVLSELAMLPFPSQAAVYYAALICELCKLSPETVGPAVGKSIRKFYAMIGDGLDVEVTRRLTDWFVVHMSNFSFNWVWKEWIPDLERPKFHPKRIFISRTLELEIRLAYHERIMKTLPDAFLDPEVECVPEMAPGPEFEFESPQHPFYEPTQSLLNLIRGRAQVDEVIPLAENLRANISENVSLSPDTTPDSAVRTITMQILLHVGSRSISHFLNAIERYLPLLRTLGSTAENKLDYLDASAKFWRRNPQMISIVFDKLMQYQIVDPSDIIIWSFKTHGDDTTTPCIGVQGWDLLKAALDKAIGRVAIARQKVQTLRKEEEDAKAKAMAVENAEEMEVDSKKAQSVNARVEEVSEALTNAEKGSTVLAREQRVALAKALEGFVSTLVHKASHEGRAVLSVEGWDSRDSWAREQWEYWTTWGWFRHFCRFYATQLKSNQITFEAGPLAELGSSEEGSPGKLVYETWCAAVGRRA